MKKIIYSISALLLFTGFNSCKEEIDIEKEEKAIMAVIEEETATINNQIPEAYNLIPAAVYDTRGTNGDVSSVVSGEIILLPELSSNPEQYGEYFAVKQECEYFLYGEEINETYYIIIGNLDEVTVAKNGEIKFNDIIGTAINKEIFCIAITETLSSSNRFSL